MLHIGLHKTATTYVQGLLGRHRAALLSDGVLYPETGTPEEVALRTRDGAQSGHGLFARARGYDPELLDSLCAEIPEQATTVLLSAEDFTLRRRQLTPEQLLGRFEAFGSVEVVLVLRRQDAWLESFYKQTVDQYWNYETRSFGEYLRQEGPALLDFHARFEPWRDLVGPDRFHVLSYDDLPDGLAICRRIVQVAGSTAAFLDDVGAAAEVPRYDSVRAIDTLGLRILNAYRFGDRDARTRVARAIYALAPAADLALLTPEERREVQRTYGPVNERIEAEWFTEPVPGLRFAAEPRRAGEPPTGPEVVAYVDQVVAACEAATREPGFRRRRGPRQ